LGLFRLLWLLDLGGRGGFVVFHFDVSHFNFCLIMVEPNNKPVRRAHFDEQELTDYDKTRG
jgi:hypothetical protein